MTLVAISVIIPSHFSSDFRHFLFYFATFCLQNSEADFKLKFNGYPPMCFSSRRESLYLILRNARIQNLRDAPTDWITHLLAVFGNVFKNVICIPSQPPSPFWQIINELFCGKNAISYICTDKT
jgi:hypothetical protein